MKKAIIAGIAWACCLSWACVHEAAGQMLFHPQVGGYYDSTEENLPDYKAEVAGLGFIAGVDVRIPDRRFFLNPGIFYTNNKSQITDESGNSEIVELMRLRLPVRMGLYLTHPDELVRYRINLGVQGSWLLDVSSTTPSISIANFNEGVVDAVAGIGVDIIWLTFDLSYARGLSPFIESNDFRANLFTATVGLALRTRQR